MADEIEIKIPDIGGATDVDVIEILVKPGDDLSVDTPIITLESDKASMEIPSPKAGKVKSIQIKVGDKVSEGDLVLTLSSEEIQKKTEIDTTATRNEAQETQTIVKPEEKSQASSQEQSTSEQFEVCIPDIGGATDVEVIEILVSLGQTIKKEQALITLEGDKATMDIPSPLEGIVEKILVKVGDKVSQNNPIILIKSNAVATTNSELATSTNKEVEKSTELKENHIEQKISSEITEVSNSTTTGSPVLGGPAVRRLAREFGINLAEVKGSGRKSRITTEDVKLYVKTRLSEKSSGSGFSLPTMPPIDFSKFGEIESKPLNKIKKLTGINVHRSWITVPHVTQFDEADITDLEAFRKAESEKTNQSGYKLTLLAFVTKVVAKALATYPQFNASLDKTGENLIYKKYFHIGIAVETTNGLVVPVIKNVDQLSIGEIALEMAGLSTKARDKGLMPTDMSGGCFTISSLGGIGGTAFTPIVNSPEVAILGLSRSSIKPVYENGEFKPRLMLPLSLSYDHRVIDGAEAARFARYLCESLADLRRILL
ncbi:MAG: dihydrolipoyllysine-residue acetyltransferase [Tatlockia sp.]|nr:dihydrolipoyllysine-residue acetyltransferase [Tatlockia sp.]